jgi:ATP-dependent helicase/nuclease subunit B
MASQLSFSDARPRPRLRLAVLPDAARVEERMASLARAHGLVARKVACTLAELERALVREAQRAGECPALAPPHALQLLVRECALTATGAFASIRHQPGFARALQDLLAAITQGLLEPAQLLRLPLPDPSRGRILPLAQALVAVRAALDLRGLAEPHRALGLAVQALEAGGALPPLLAGIGELEFDCILDWTPLRVRLVAALAARTRVRVRLPWSAGRADLTDALEPALRAFERLAAPALELDLFEPGKSGPLAPFLQRLFVQAPLEASPGLDAPVLLRSCASPSAQAREVANSCADLIAGGAAPESIAIAARSLAGGVAEELGAALDRLRLTWRERRGRPALPAPPIRLALSLYELLDRDFPREPLIALLCSRLIWLRSGEGEHLPGHVVARLLREAHVRDDASDGGVSARIAALAARRKAKDPAFDPAELEEVRVRAQRAIEALRGLPSRATLRDHAAALLDLLARWDLQRRLRTAPPGSSGGLLDGASGAQRPSALEHAALGALARDQSALRALEDACAALSRAARAVGLGDRVYARSEWAQILATALADASLPPCGARGGAIQLVELRELPGRHFAHVLIAGLIDGELPARPTIDPLLSDEDRRALNRAAGHAVFRPPADANRFAADAEALPAPGLLPPQKAEEPLLFHLGLCAASSSTALFWPRADARGREVLRSPFVDDALRALGLADDSASRAPLSPIPTAARCRTPQALLARAALDAFADPAWRVSRPAATGPSLDLLAAVGDSSLAARLARVARAALAEKERLRVFVGEVAPGRFSGGLSGKALDAIAPKLRFGPDAPLSAHQLEEHATCGFRTLGHRLLRVARDEQDDDDLGSRERGTLLHRCLEAFFQRLGGQSLRADASQLQLLHDTTDAEMDRFAAQEHVGHRALWELRRGELHALLLRVIESEAQAGAQPVELEQQFGFDGAWAPLQVVAPDGERSVFVRGAVDRIDRGPGGALVVLDYKSGSIEPLKRKLKPAWLLAPEFQLAVYAALLRQRHPDAPVDALYLSLKDAARTKALSKTIDLDALLETAPKRRQQLRELPSPPPNFADAVFDRVDRMRGGLFPVKPLSCDFCDLKPACRLVALPTDPDENGGEVPRV